MGTDDGRGGHSGRRSCEEPLGGESGCLPLGTPEPQPRARNSRVLGVTPMACRPGCAACCIAPSISSPIPGMPAGKPAGVRCVQLTAEGLCRLYGRPERPRVCASFRASADACGDSREEAMQNLARLEVETR